MGVKDRIGEMYGFLKIIKKAIPPQHVKNKDTYWECICLYNNCGNIKIIRNSNLVFGSTTSCGCYHKKIIGYDLIDQIFGYLKVIKQVPIPKNVKKERYWECECLYNNCGNKKILTSSEIMKGQLTCGAHMNQINSIQIIEQSQLGSLRKVWENRYKNIDWEIFKILSQSSCFYCGLPAEKSNRFNVFLNRKRASDFSKENGFVCYNGLDRIDPIKGYIEENVVPCCRMCNTFKLTLSLEKLYVKISNLNNIPIVNIKTINNNLKLKEIFPYKPKNKNVIEARIDGIISGAKTRNLSFELTRHQAAEFLISSCAYCNEQPDPINGKFGGIDRIDNDKGYILENCFPACRNCNAGKNDNTLEEFLNWIIRIKNHQEIK